MTRPPPPRRAARVPNGAAMARACARPRLASFVSRRNTVPGDMRLCVGRAQAARSTPHTSRYAFDAARRPPASTRSGARSHCEK